MAKFHDDTHKRSKAANKQATTLENGVKNDINTVTGRKGKITSFSSAAKNIHKKCEKWQKAHEKTGGIDARVSRVAGDIDAFADSFEKQDQSAADILHKDAENLRRAQRTSF